MSAQHIVPLRVYFSVFAALLAFTALTVWVAYIDLGALNIYVALGIAATKASLVMLYFMHLKYSSRLAQLFSVSGFLWLALLLGFVLADENTRDWLHPPSGWAGQYEQAPASHDAPQTEH